MAMVKNLRTTRGKKQLYRGHICTSVVSEAHILGPIYTLLAFKGLIVS